MNSLSIVRGQSSSAKEPLGELRQYQNLEQARRSIDHFLEEVYNQRRLHSALGYLPPAQFERDWHEQNKKEAAARQLPL